MDFYGSHQAGIATPSQEYLQFGSFEMIGDSLANLTQLLRSWSDAAALMSRGLPVGPVQTGTEAPADTGEALGLEPSDLTITFGIGPSVFSVDGRDRFGLAAQRPDPLVELPPFAGDDLDPSLCGGDLGVQVCASDPLVAFHAVHNLVRIASSIAVPKWLLSGFGRTSNSRNQVTPRNLMGFKDGTANIMAEDSQGLDRFVWAGKPDSPAWMRGGSYMVVRRIQMMLGEWDATGLDDQQRTFGRKKVSGAPLTGSREDDPLDLQAEADGVPVIPADAHIRLASPDYNEGQRILRRGYGYADGIDPATDAVAGGLLFICYQRDPRLQFIPIQRRLAASDSLNRHIQHVGSAVFACPPGARPGGFVGEALLI